MSVQTLNCVFPNVVCNTVRKKVNHLAYLYLTTSYMGRKQSEYSSDGVDQLIAQLILILQATLQPMVLFMPCLLSHLHDQDSCCLSLPPHFHIHMLKCSEVPQHNRANKYKLLQMEATIFSGGPEVQEIQKGEGRSKGEFLSSYYLLIYLSVALSESSLPPMCYYET